MKKKPEESVPVIATTPEETVPNPSPTPAATGQSITDVNTKEAFEMLSQRSDIIILDVRTPEEFSSGHIEGALNINIADSNFKDRVAELERENSYLVHCGAGAPHGRSRRSVALMEELGFKKIYHLDGGYIAWRQAGYTRGSPKAKE